MADDQDENTPEQRVVLVVEDEIIIREDVSEHLEECGFSVLQAPNAQVALTTLLSGEHIDLVFTDVRMPGNMDGIELARWVLNHDPQIAVIITSGDIGRIVAIEELCGLHAFAKPYWLAEVEAKIRVALLEKTGKAGQPT